MLVIITAAGCVERNIEKIGRDEAASIPPPPPPQAPSQQAPGAGPAATEIAGLIELSPELAGSVPPNATLYIIVRVAGREGGAPLAVQQVPSPDFPHAFVITERDAMIAGTPLIGEMSLTARVDQDGDAFTTTAGDLSGTISPVEAGGAGIVVRLTERLSGDAGR